MKKEYFFSFCPPKLLRHTKQLKNKAVPNKFRKKTEEVFLFFLTCQYFLSLLVLLKLFGKKIQKKMNGQFFSNSFTSHCLISTTEVIFLLAVWFFSQPFGTCLATYMSGTFMLCCKIAMSRLDINSDSPLIGKHHFCPTSRSFNVSKQTRPCFYCSAVWYASGKRLGKEQLMRMT